jgi:hypothetical protein
MSDQAQFASEITEHGIIRELAFYNLLDAAILDLGLVK